jgi:hypothetical protein
MKRPPLLFGVLLLVSLLTACSSGAAATPASSPTKTVPVIAPTPTRELITSPIVGTYSATITKQDVAKMPDRSINLGTHKWSFNDNGTYNWIFNGPNTNGNGVDATGQYQVSQGELSLTDPVCASVWNAPMGTYSWVLNGNMLILQAKDDGCLDRQFVLTTHPLLRQGS